MIKKLCTAVILTLSILSLTAMRSQDESQSGQPTRTFLNDSITEGGIMSADSILYFMNKPLYSQDTAGNMHQVLSFLFTYIERDIYINEDGKPYIGTEIGGTSSKGGIVPDSWRDLVKAKIKSGDTVIFNNPVAYMDHKDEQSAYYSPRIVLVVK